MSLKGLGPSPEMTFYLFKYLWRRVFHKGNTTNNKRIALPPLLFGVPWIRYLLSSLSFIMQEFAAAEGFSGELHQWDLSFWSVKQKEKLLR